MRYVARSVLFFGVALTSLPSLAQEVATAAIEGKIEPISGFTGEMSMTIEASTPDELGIDQVIRFEPWQMLDDLFRDDIVFLMRTGPSDWMDSDAPNARSDACAAQRQLSALGEDLMQQFGSLMIVNDIRPSQIMMSDWCRSEQTYEELKAGMVALNPTGLDSLERVVSGDLNPLGSLDGPNDVEVLRQTILNWNGSGGNGPLLILTHFENIEALTEFRVYEGEMLVIDPTRNGRVLGYLRLGSAAPDPIHFPADVVAFAQEQAASESD